jgi:hypothetical protein
MPDILHAVDVEQLRQILLIQLQNISKIPSNPITSDESTEASIRRIKRIDDKYPNTLNELNLESHQSNARKIMIIHHKYLNQRHEQNLESHIGQGKKKKDNLQFIIMKQPKRILKFTQQNARGFKNMDHNSTNQRHEPQDYRNMSSKYRAMKTTHHKFPNPPNKPEG